MLTRQFSLNGSGLPQLIRVELDGELAEARIEARLIDIDRYTELVVCICRSLEVEVDFVDSEGKVCKVNGNQYVFAMLDEAWAARLWLRITGTDEDAV
jgi:hypothetical protein